MSPQESDLFRRLHDLSAQEPAAARGDALERALAEAAPLLGRLAARPAAARPGARLDAAVSFARALRELSRLVASEAARLCELAARGPASGFAPADLAELLDEELRCAQDLRSLGGARLRRLRALVARLARGDVDAPALLAAAAELRSPAPRRRARAPRS